MGRIWVRAERKEEMREDKKHARPGGAHLVHGFAVSAIVFILVYYLVDVFVLSSFGRVKVELQADTSSAAKIFWSVRPGHNSFSEEMAALSKKYPTGEKVTLEFRFDNQTIKRLRLDPGQGPGVYSLYTIKLYSFFGRPVVIHPHKTNLPLVAGPGTILNPRQDHLEIHSSTADPYLIIDADLRVPGKGYRFATPLIFAVLSFILVMQTRGTSLQFWADLQYKKPSSGNNYQALDGLRGLAALLVLADHSGVVYCNGLGMVGVTIFFCLSGFLLTMPYAKDGRRVTDYSYVRNYFVRRLRRIVPMYYVVIFFTYFMVGRLADTVRSMLFLQGNTIYWTVLQEMHFYLLLLPLLLVHFFVLRGRVWLIAGLLMVLSYCFGNGILGSYTVYGLGQSMPLYLGIFLSGMAACYLYHVDAVRTNGLVQRCCNSQLLPLLLMIPILGVHQLWPLFFTRVPRTEAWILLGNYSYLVALLLFVLVMSDRSIVARILSSLPLRMVGLVSYSFYLLHPAVVRAVKTGCRDFLGIPVNNTAAFGAALVLTFLISCVTYTVIERPFLMVSHRDTLPPAA